MRVFKKISQKFHKCFNENSYKECIIYYSKMFVESKEVKKRKMCCGKSTKKSLKKEREKVILLEG